MTIRNAYENCLIELNKVQAPSLLVDDFIYLFNKAVLQYVNKRYNLFETKQQLTDDLRVLTKTIKIIPQKEKSLNIFGQSWECILPDDYMHILNCVCEFPYSNNDHCHTGEDVYHQGANKLDTTLWAHVINNYYMLPSAKRPYYYIINIEDPIKNGISDDIKKDPINSGNRYGNSVLPTMLIKCGDAMLKAVYVDYLRAPQYLTLDQELLDEITDNSSIIEFPDYVVYEIINEIVTIIMENGSNPRTQNYQTVTKTIV